QLLTLNRFSPLSPTIPAHRRHSPPSPIIPVHTQKQGGRGRYLNGDVSKLCRRADIFGHDVLQGTADANSAYRAPTGGEKNQPEGWPLQGRGGKRQGRKKRHSGEWRSRNAIRENGDPRRLFFGGRLWLDHLAVVQLVLEAAPLDAPRGEGGEPDGEMEQIAQRHQPKLAAQHSVVQAPH